MDYKDWKLKGIDTILEISVNEVGFEGGRGSAPVIVFYMTANARLISTQDGRELYAGEYNYKSEPRKFADWVNYDALFLKKEFVLSYMVLAEQIMDEAFVLFDIPLSYFSPYGYCSIKPAYPEIRFSFFKKDMDYIRVGTSSPTLKWESFPGKRDKECIDSETLKKITAVTYDLKIWQADNGHVGKLVYSKGGIPNPYHTIESQLCSNTKYFWTVRAKFVLEGRKRATRWACSRRPMENMIDTCKLRQIPDRNYFRFTTEP